MSGVHAISMPSTREGRLADRLRAAGAPRISHAQAVGAALSVGERVARCTGLDDNHQAAAPGPRVALRLDDGLPGIVLFFAELGAVAEQPRFSVLARAAATRIAHLVPDLERQLSVGALSGLGGLVYSLSRLGTLWHDAALFGLAEQLVPTMAARIVATTDPGISSGLAGASAGLLALHSVTGSLVALEVARRCGERLLETAQRTAHGLSWPCRDGIGIATGGFAHGVAGIAWALHQLGRASGDARFDRAGTEADEFQEWLLSSAVRLRYLSADSTGRTEIDAAMPLSMLESWCWGAGGVGLALTRQRGARGNRRPPLGLDLALGQVLAHPVRTDDSLCHGTMADVELLLESARAYGDANLRAEAERRAMTVIGHDCLVWRSSASVDEETPGLMTGLSGIGYGLLRVVAPEHVPSILLLDTGRKVSVRSAA